MTVGGNFANCLSSCCACLHNLHNDLLSSRLWNPQFGSSFPSNPPTTNANLLFAWQNLQKNVYPKELVDLKLNPYTNMDFQGSLFHPGALHPCFSKKKTPTNQRWCHFPLQPKRDLQGRVFQNLWHHRKEVLLLQHLMEGHGRFRSFPSKWGQFWSKKMELIRGHQKHP